MVEYIEREAVKKEFNLNFGSVSHAVIANRLIDAIPAADVVEVVHGVCDYCQKFDDPCGIPMIAIEEDECDRGIYLYNGYLCANGGSFCEAKVKFCPMCGRRLDGE